MFCFNKNWMGGLGGGHRQQDKKDNSDHKNDLGSVFSFLVLSTDIETDSSQIIYTELFATSQIPKRVH